MTSPLDFEDITAQQERLTATRAALAASLTALAVEAKSCAKAAANKHSTPDLNPVYAAVRNVERAEEAVDLAALDVHTASGYDA